MCDCPIVCVLSGLPLTSTRFQSRIFVERLCLCLTASCLHEGVRDYMRLTLCWPYCRSFRVEGFSPRNPTFAWVGVVLSRCHKFSFYGTSCFGILLGWLLENRLLLKKLLNIIGIVLRRVRRRMRITRSLIVNRARWRSVVSYRKAVEIVA